MPYIVYQENIVYQAVMTVLGRISVGRGGNACCFEGTRRWVQTHAGTKWDNSSIQWIAIEEREMIPFEITVDRCGRSLPEGKNDPLLRDCHRAMGRQWIHEGCRGETIL